MVRRPSPSNNEVAATLLQFGISKLFWPYKERARGAMVGWACCFAAHSPECCTHYPHQETCSRTKLPARMAWRTCLLGICPQLLDESTRQAHSLPTQQRFNGASPTMPVVGAEDLVSHHYYRRGYHGRQVTRDFEQEDQSDGQIEDWLEP